MDAQPGDRDSLLLAIEDLKTKNGELEQAHATLLRQNKELAAVADKSKGATSDSQLRLQAEMFDCPINP